MRTLRLSRVATAGGPTPLVARMAGTSCTTPCVMARASAPRACCRWKDVGILRGLEATAAGAANAPSQISIPVRLGVFFGVLENGVRQQSRLPRAMIRILQTILGKEL